ncbi:hypothetical protein BWK60_13390 [Flavobacterium covae]|uniref:hypothetical protein n=1 Tax=Flavobacterium covae TaxID=2906076 RepID=UPI000B4D3CE2|nr:hypothetical protein [Flavobacterium covae]OWP85576.1 hypothetical protein BWK60_13390 [Flavobacterium covae]
MELKEVLKNFVSTFGRDNTDLGKVNFVDQNNVPEDSLDALYHYLQFDESLVIGGELYIDIYPKAMQEKIQEGWYILKDNGQVIYDDVNWNKDWVVFATRHGDAIYFDRNNGEVCASINKISFFKLADSLAMFFKILLLGMKIEQKKYDLEAFDDDEETLPEFIEDVKSILKETTNNKFKSDFISFFFE